MTVVIQIGNSDNKLTQTEWAFFCEHMKRVIEKWVKEIHFGGGSSFDSPWQNACWVCEIPDEAFDGICDDIEACRASFKQDSVAVTVGDTFFV